MQELTTNPGPLSPFHLAFPVHDLAAARAFYGEGLGCPEGRSSEDWVDFNFYGHQIVAHLAPDETGLPPRLDLERPFFVTIGTIEPRKNHALLLDVWERLAQRHPATTLPQLFIIGRRGWKNAAVFARLDALPPDGPVRELAGLDDGAVAALLLRSRALVMPSRAEGFGLPLTEAAGRGIPVLCAPLPSAIELLGDHAHYLPPDDIAAWTDEIARLADQPPLRNAALPPPDWERHFRTVYNALMENRN